MQKRALLHRMVTDEHSGNSNVPLGFISLTENIFMIGAAIWMWVK